MLDISALNPYIRLATQSVVQKNHKIKRRIIFDYELIYIANGKFVICYNDVEYVCEKGQFVLIRPGIPHSFLTLETEVEQPHIHFDITHTVDSVQVPVCFKDLNALTEKEKKWIRRDLFEAYPKTPFVHFSKQDKVLDLFRQVVGKSEVSMITRKAKFMQILEEMIYDNFPTVFEENQTANRVEKQVKSYIDAGQGLTAKLEDIAKQFNYSLYHLERRFKKCYGTGVAAYRNEVRMQRAKEMLMQNSVSEVSQQMGFSSIYVFSRAFKNRFGLSPTEFKKDFTL